MTVSDTPKVVSSLVRYYRVIYQIQRRIAPALAPGKQTESEPSDFLRLSNILGVAFYFNSVLPTDREITQQIKYCTGCPKMEEFFNDLLFYTLYLS